MQLNNSDKSILITALDTEIARLKRAINAEKNQQIKEIVHGSLLAVQELQGRVHKEPAK